MAFWSKFKRVIAKPKILLRVSLRDCVNHSRTQPRSQGPLYISRERTLVAAGYVIC